MNDETNEPVAAAPETPTIQPTGSTEEPRSFAQEAEVEAPGLAREFWDFLKVNKKWWLGPIVVTLLLVSFLLIVGGSAAPFIYALF